MDYSFILLETTLEKALNLGESPEVNITIDQQIQLLPQNPKPYIQTSNRKEGVSLGGNVKAFLVDCQGVEEDITEYFKYEQLTDVKSISQIIFRLAYLPTDHYADDIYLKITSDTNTYYSNKFRVTNLKCKEVSRIDYKDLRGLSATATDPDFINAYDSVGLNFYFKGKLPKTELTTYTQITTGLVTSSRVENTWLNKYYFRFANAWIWQRLSRAIYDNSCYIEFVWNGATEAIEYNERLGASNTSENYFTTQPNENDKIYVVDVIVGVVEGFVFDYELDLILA